MVLCEKCSADELADATGGADATLSLRRELLSAHDARDLGDLTLAEDLEETLQQHNRLLFNKKETYSLGNIDHSSFLLGRGLACLLGHEGPQLVNIHRGLVVLVLLVVEVSLTILTEVARMAAQRKEHGRLAIKSQTRHPGGESEDTYYFCIMILWWCMPPALPRPLGCFL